MTLAELRQMAARQQHQIEAQQQLLVAKEQRLKFLKQQEARHHNLTDHQLDTACLQNLREKIETQELKLRQLRALRGQVEQQKTNNENLGTELDSIRALFSEKEKELNLAVGKVDELTRQLDEIKNNKNRKKYISSSASELENLRRELLYRTKLSEQQNNYIYQQREDIAHRQKDISVLDKKINDLTQRLHRKRQLNEQLAAQIHHTRNSNNNGQYHAATIVAVEPLPREPPEPEHTRDDISAKLRGSQGDLGEFSTTKNDPKYQTLPYNTKFTLKGKNEESLSSSNEDDSWPNSLDSDLANRKLPPLSVVKPSQNVNLAPRPLNSKVASKVASQPAVKKENSSLDLDNHIHSLSKEKPMTKSESANNNVAILNSASDAKSITNNGQSKPLKPKSMKPAVPPKPALPVKPVFGNRPNLLMAKQKEDKDLVNKALSVLQNKSSKNEKSAIRYNHFKENIQEIAPKSAIATYFQKTLIEPSVPLESRKNDSSNLPDSPKRKPSTGQLPIKPKPLTIRKTPGLEPPKLKVQPVINTNFSRKTSDTHLAAHLKPSYLPQSEEAKNQPPKVHETSNEEDKIPIQEVAPLKKEIDILPEKLSSKSVPEDQVSVAAKENGAAYDETDFIKTEVIEERSESTTDAASKEPDSEECHSAALRRIRKGNLKGENSSRSCRRVSFDPLALLLDAALEGELELVKKTAGEVPNPSAANDEGITALHNAICAGHVEVVTFLVEFGCDVNAQDSDGWTPLHCAASCNNLLMVKFLVEKGACVFATTLSDHETAAEKCEEDEEGFDGCSEYLYSLQENLGVMNEGTVYAVYDYEVQNADELGFKDGDSLTVLRKGDDDESEWWWSRLSDREGYVPRNLLGLYPRVTSQKEECLKNED
ncbi:hypothetical protein JTE90_007459 [Oedothorax gibbosus]|uniref:SH3 domain-containing protein n=1 Tax=Oedothorax gibbosus TaxID=931172 RepID=A0AAV6UA27_9ARAC|nr:hypothetical protein JTE90_007459 [Oedothorax gibbosus]